MPKTGPCRGRNCGKNENAKTAAFGLAAIVTREARNAAAGVRPDGSRRAFRPYPTPLFDADGELTGAINLLVDVTDEQAEVLHEQADRCRRLASALYSRESTTVLSRMADGFEKSAAELASARDS